MNAPQEATATAAGSHRRRMVSLAVLVIAISALHYETSPERVVLHEVFQRLYYVPIILAGYWYGVLGGVAMGVLVSIVYTPHILMVWSAGLQEQASRFAELAIFNVVGLVVGLLAAAQRRVTERYRRTAASLETANRELHDSYEQLQRADRLKTLGEVAAGLAHEIRHPLASIGGSLEIIESRAAADSPEVEFSRLARVELDRLDRLVTDFLRFARPRDPELQEVVVRDVVERAMTLARVEADHAGVRLATDAAAPAQRAAIDPQQIEQVLLNIILNAVQATPAGGAVTVRESVEGAWVRLDVLDEGPGVPEEQRERIFSPFFTTKKGGTGLGLAIAQRIVVAHGGGIEMMPGDHGCFRVRLPIRASDAPRSAAAADARR